MRYQQIFDEAIGSTPPSTVDVDQVVRRQRWAARVRPALAVAATVLVGAAGVAMATIQLSGQDRSPVGPADALAGFPEYAEGTLVVAAESAPMADRSLTITFTPTTLELVLFTRCDDHGVDDPNLGLNAELSIGDVNVDRSFCNLGLSEGGGGGPEAWAELWADAGVEIGVPTAITITLTEVAAQAIEVDQAPPLPSEGTFAVAVAESVPFEEYQLPPPPDTLAPLPEASAGDIELRADPTDPSRRVEQTMEWDSNLAGCGSPGSVFPLELVSQTPGSLRVLIDEVEVAYHTWWDYQQHRTATELTPVCGEVDDGDEVTIAVEPTHMTGDWQVRFNHSG